jgi:hypothetical protein
VKIVIKEKKIRERVIWRKRIIELQAKPIVMWDLQLAYRFARVSDQFTVIVCLDSGKKKVEKFESLEMVVRPNSVVKFQGFVSTFVCLLRNFGKRKQNIILISLLFLKVFGYIGRKKPINYTHGTRYDGKKAGEKRKKEELEFES